MEQQLEERSEAQEVQEPPTPKEIFDLFVGSLADEGADSVQEARDMLDNEEYGDWLAYSLELVLGRDDGGLSVILPWIEWGIRAHLAELGGLK